ncbi:hypothetical protein RNJ44_01554 [Nakaseomyces bracarensis]|uniref:Uncharacterized protein n=1 Tax=Nakaseomyces bracarensis TaxID=273131 RepID=A0ABR4NQ71_9SACH
MSGVVRRFIVTKSSARYLSKFRRWHELNLDEQHDFINKFADTYKQHYPSSKTNVSIKGLMNDMEKYRDSPSVFGIFYNSICDYIDHGRDNGRFSHKSFQNLVIQRNK